MLLLPEGEKNEILGVKDDSVHFLTAGSKGKCYPRERRMRSWV